MVIGFLSDAQQHEKICEKQSHGCITKLVHWISLLFALPSNSDAIQTKIVLNLWGWFTCDNTRASGLCLALLKETVGHGGEQIIYN